MLNERRPIISLVNTLVGAAVCITGNWLIIPIYGIPGVAGVAVISMASSAILTNIFFSRKIMIIQIKSLSFLGGRK
jgi:O-antigen/teichoic acid export membrane protein